MTRMTMEKTYYVDHVGYEVNYNLGEREMTVLQTGELYHYFNGFMLLTVI